jgi:hypothetical protein
MKKNVVQKVNEVKKQYAKWAAKPITRGDYVNLCKWSFGISLALCAVELVVFKCIEVNEEKQLKESTEQAAHDATTSWNWMGVHDNEDEDLVDG